MPIVKCKNSRLDPRGIVEYIMNPEKVIAAGNLGFMTADTEMMVKQMRDTMRLHGKENGRQYYHVIVAFDPDDRPENGGKLQPTLVNTYAAQYASKLWPTREVIWACQDHGGSIHIHFVVAACDMETGRKLDVNNKMYREWKDYAQQLAVCFELKPLDWRNAVKEKKKRDRQSGSPVYENLSERGMKRRGKITYKDQLREIIDRAIDKVKNVDEFRTELEHCGVTLTRCTANTISYKCKNRRAYRGDILGDDYTAIAIRNRLAYNQKQTGLAVKMKEAELRSRKGHILTDNEKEQMYSLGRTIGMTREEVAMLIDHASYSDWKRKNAAWNEWKRSKEEFWNQYNQSKLEISAQLDELYRKRKWLKEAEWLLHPYNQKKSLWGVLYAIIILLTIDGSLSQIDKQIDAYKKAREKLQKNVGNVKKVSKETNCLLKEESLSVQEYLCAVSLIHDATDEIVCAALGISLDRQYVLNESYEMVLKNSTKEDIYSL